MQRKNNDKKLVFLSLGPLACLCNMGEREWRSGRGVGGTGGDGRWNMFFPLLPLLFNPPPHSLFPPPHFTPLARRDNKTMLNRSLNEESQKPDHIMSHVVWSHYGQLFLLDCLFVFSVNSIQSKS